MTFFCQTWQRFLFSCDWLLHLQRLEHCVQSRALSASTSTQRGAIGKACKSCLLFVLTKNLTTRMTSIACAL